MSILDRFGVRDTDLIFHSTAVDPSVVSLALRLVTKEYNPDEARDDHGRWTSGGGMPYTLNEGYESNQLSPEDSVRANTAFRNVSFDPIAVQMGEKGFDSFVQDGKMKSAYDVATNFGDNAKVSDAYLSNRAELELGRWGIPEDAEHPIYGYMDTKFEGHSPEVHGYGGVQVTMKDEVAGRTTMAIGDTLNEMSTPIPVLDARSGNFTDKALNEATQGRFQIGDRQDLQYYEAQIHGGVTLSDIKSVSYFSWAEINHNTQAILDAHGIQVVRRKD